jgi:cyclopropane fatty-acyl-phospholipid synthase-like methyltransferase
VTASSLILIHRNRDYYRCTNCDLIFVPSCFHLKPHEEKKRYDCHQNDINDAGYRNFLNLIFEPLTKHLKPGMKGLDFGSGPGPVLNHMLTKAGYPTATYDPLFASHPEALKQQYDFVTCTEVVEHFSHPQIAWRELTSLVKNNGFLAIMTLLHDSVSDFSTWWYKNDPTHVAFYSSRTMTWIANNFGLKKIYQDHEQVILFQREPERELPVRSFL